MFIIIAYLPLTGTAREGVGGESILVPFTEMSPIFLALMGRYFNKLVLGNVKPRDTPNVKALGLRHFPLPSILRHWPAFPKPSLVAGFSYLPPLFSPLPPQNQRLLRLKGTDL